MHWLTLKFKSLPKVNVESLPTLGLVPLHARGDNNECGQIFNFDAPVEGGDSQVGKRCLRTDAMVSGTCGRGGITSENTLQHTAHLCLTA